MKRFNEFVNETKIENFEIKYGLIVLNRDDVFKHYYENDHENKFDSFARDSYRLAINRLKAL